MAASQPSPSTIPVFLLKTKSVPADSYEEYFSKAPFRPIFVPVLEHRENKQNLAILSHLFLEDELGRHGDAQYGGMIFTSQRAVEAFAKVVADVDEADADSAEEHSNQESIENQTVFPLYVVGPATERTLLSLVSSSHTLRGLNAHVLGAHTGNGEALAHFILHHYNALPGVKTALLFLVGEQRRDSIPRILMEEHPWPDELRVEVKELVVYETGVMSSFATDFTAHIMATESERQDEHPVAVVVVFSPSGCEAMLRCLDLLDVAATYVKKDLDGSSSEVALQQRPERSRYIVATIGPTTRDHLQNEFGFTPEVCADKPGPQGVGGGVMKALKQYGMA